MTAPLTGSPKAIPEKLPLWRAIAGFGVLAGMVAVLLSLAPVYLENYQLQRALTQMARDPHFAATTDDVIRGQVMARAHELHLPLKSGDIHIERPGGGVDQPGGALKLELKYAVDMNLALYRVDLHFHPGVTAAPASKVR